jgi:5-carboxymethyl-2-hydroxymuconic-semialdehyde dehydrogenase
MDKVTASRDYSFEFNMETRHVSLARGTHKNQRLGI